MWSGPGESYFCGNEDWSFIDPVLASEPGNGAENGYIAFGWKRYYPQYVQAGVNSEGLCFDIAVVPGQNYIPDPSKTDFRGDLPIRILKTCRKADEAVAVVRRYNFSLPASEHIMFADASAGVVEYNGGSLQVIESDGSFQIATDFHLSDPSLGGYPCRRYETLDNRLKTFGRLHGIGDLRDALDASSRGGTYPTVYSYIVYLAKMELHVYLDRDYSRPAVFSIPDLLRDASTIDLPHRFGRH